MARRTQSERSGTTRRLLLDAAVESLVERGWAATTAVDVCARAGVTRGALVHHFPSLAALLADALEDLYSQLSTAPARPIDSLTSLLDDTWQRVSRREFKAVIEAWFAAGNDPDLRVTLEPVITRFSKLVSPEGIPVADLFATPDAVALYLTAREAMLGLALGRAMNQGRALPHEATVLGDLRARAGHLDERSGES